VANTYLVAPADIAAELPGLFPGGFTATSTPTSALVQGLINTADTIVTLEIRDSTGQVPAPTDAAAPLAIRYIVETVKAAVLRIIYAGRDPNYLAGTIGPYDVLAKTAFDAIALLGSQAIGTGEAAALIVGHMTTRPLLIDSWDLGDCGRGRF
jgi:hypothetical protein